MSSIQIKTVGTNFKVSNGIVTLEGPNRTLLLQAMDLLESHPAAAQEIQKKVEKAGEVVREKIAEKKQSRRDAVLALIGRKGQATAADVIDALAKEGQTTAQWGYLLLTMQRDEKLLKRKKMDGVWTYSLRK